MPGKPARSDHICARNFPLKTRCAMWFSQLSLRTPPMLQKRKKSEATSSRANGGGTNSRKKTAPSIVDEFAELLPKGGLQSLKKKQHNSEQLDHLLQVGKYKAFPIRISHESDQLKFLFIRKLKNREEVDSDFSIPEGLAEDRTLVVVNLVYDATEEDVRTIFSSLGGSISQIKFIELPDDTSQRVCLVEFETEDHLNNLLSSRKSDVLKLGLFEKGFVRGMDKWLAEFKLSRPDPEVLQKQVDEFMVEYDKREEERKRQREKLASQPDADGFVTVVRRGRKMVSDGKASVQAVRASDVKVTPQETLTDFYRFQKREAKREQLENLQKKFEEDKQRIAKMKQNRKFKPY